MRADRSKDLTPATARTVGAALRRDDGAGHPWPQVLPRTRWGGRPAEPLAYTRVHPDTVVELVVDPAVDGPRWRHPATVVRLRPDLQPTDLAPTPTPHSLDLAAGDPAEGGVHRKTS